MRRAIPLVKTVFSLYSYKTPQATQGETQAGKPNRRLRHAPSRAAYQGLPPRPIKRPDMDA